MDPDALRHGRFARFGEAISDWEEMTKKLATLREDARIGLKARADKANWAGLNAQVGGEFIDKTAKDSDKKATEEPGTPVAASRVCDGAFDAPAAEALRRLAGTDRFDETAGSGKAGESAKFSLAKAVEHLHDTYRRRSACWVYKTGDDSGEPLLEIRFSASQGYPPGTSEETGSGKVTYPVGRFAQAGPNGADLFFQAPPRRRPRSPTSATRDT
ncbi:hypothetical protein ACFY2V_21295 [Streptomyces eurythermus]|uniref:hypothetical protein n=1 Tax=Streptomyces eurythermus TaxID=42237 RepID=UPI0036A2BDD8